MVKKEYGAALPQKSPDGGLVRELMDPENGDASLREVVIAPLQRSAAHRHPEADEIHHFLEGAGSMRVGNRVLFVRPRDTVRVRKGEEHQVENSENCFLRVLIFSVPAHRGEDTEVLEEDT